MAMRYQRARELVCRHTEELEVSQARVHNRER